MKNNKGQLAIEMVLLMTVTLGLLMYGTKELRENKALAKIIGGPWSRVAGMMEAGVWQEPEAARKLHPNQTERNLSLDPNSI